jgi:hypothetical protein
MLRVAGFLRGQAEFSLFDFLDRLDARVPKRRYRADSWGRGEFFSQLEVKPPIFADIARRFYRFGLPRGECQTFLAGEGHYDFALIQTGMTYWYPGVQEVIEEIRAQHPETKIILGGVYATICPAHARGLGTDLVVEGTDLAPCGVF